MNIATKNNDGILKTLDELKKEGYEYVKTIVTCNYNTNCYSYTPINNIIEDVKSRGQINLNWKGLFDTKINYEITKNYKCIYNIHGIYQTARKKII